MLKRGVAYWHWLRLLPGKMLARFILREIPGYVYFSVVDIATLKKNLEPCDVLLVEGNQWVSGAIKYLTQSTWSHAAMYVGDIISAEENAHDPKVLIEADIEKGVIGIPLSEYEKLNVRICRPVGLSTEDKDQIISYMMKNLGNSYDLKHVFDLARYLLPNPPVPARFRRKMIALGSGDPTRAICSSLIAAAFQSIHYPILPITTKNDEFLQIRHHSLFTPKDFDVSPYFKVVKPKLMDNFDFRELPWEPSHNQDKTRP